MNTPIGNKDIPSTQFETGYAYSVTRRLITLMSVVMVLAALAVAVLTLNDFNRLLTPDLENKARMIGRVIETDLENALSYGIPFEAVYGADAYLKEIIENHDELTYLAIVGTDNKLLYQSGSFSEQVKRFLYSTSLPPAETEVTKLDAAVDHAIPIISREAVIGSIHVGIDRQFAQRQLDDILFDIIVILVAAVLVTVEVLLALLLVYGTGPVHRLNFLLDQHSKGDFTHILTMRMRDEIGRAAHLLSEEARKLHISFRNICAQSGIGLDTLRAEVSLEGAGAKLRTVGKRFGLLGASGPIALRQAEASDIRIPLFVFAFAEELQKSFLPLFIRDIYTPISWLSEPVVIGLPIIIYLGVLAIASPFVGSWVERHGSRRLFLAGLVPSVAGFLGCTVAGTIEELMLWRGLTALGYALITIGCQDYVISNSTTTHLNKNLIAFVGIIMSATMCGTAIGGILADWMGYHAVFSISALLVVFAGVLAAGMLTDDRNSFTDATTSRKTTPTSRLRSAVSVLSNFRFVLFLLCVAVPTNVLVAAYLWYLAPLYLSDLGASASEIARVIMIYYLLIVILSPFASKIFDRPGRSGWLVGLGSLFSAGGMILFYDWQSIWAIFLSVVLLGLAHALTRGAQLPLALEICAREIPVVGRTTVLSFLRFLERTGSMLGLLLAAMLIEPFGYQGTIGITGALVCGSALIFLIAHSVFYKASVTLPLK